MPGIALRDQPADRRLGAAVGGGDRIEAGLAELGGLVLQPVLGAEQRQDLGRRGAVQLDQEGVQLGQARGV